VYPALTVLKELGKRYELRSGVPDGSANAPSQELTVLWVGGEGGVEADLVKRAGIPFKAIPAAGVHGVGVRAMPGNLSKLGRGTLTARNILLSYKPDTLFFTGGFVAIPVGLAARLFIERKSRPRILLYIPDIEPGQALKTLTHMADHIAVTTEESKTYLPARKPATCTGYPVRQELMDWDRDRAFMHFGLRSDLPILLAFGGSKGARSINRALLDALPRLLQEIQVLHVSGVRDWEEIDQRQGEIPPELHDRYRVYPYLHEEMGAAMAIADLVLSRAGAAILGEYPHFGLPAILVPYPHAWRYQHTNASYLVRLGGAILVEDAQLGDKLVPEVLSLIFDRQKLAEMKRAMSSAATPDAATRIAGILKNLSLPADRTRM
jgi:UDP-N-acetylglucosamine--N-acetylmuramyl-(pentapeptide) pyrophosphoryl-undecaprenol N-acetylglucosamine transferase